MMEIGWIPQGGVDVGFYPHIEGNCRWEWRQAMVLFEKKTTE